MALTYINPDALNVSMTLDDNRKFLSFQAGAWRCVKEDNIRCFEDAEREIRQPGRRFYNAFLRDGVKQKILESAKIIKQDNPVYYDGSKNSEGQRQGFGYARYADGSEHYGEWLSNTWHGLGVTSWPEKDKTVFSFYKLGVADDIYITYEKGVWTVQKYQDGQLGNQKLSMGPSGFYGEYINDNGDKVIGSYSPEGDLNYFYRGDEECTYEKLQMICQKRKAKE